MLADGGIGDDPAAPEHDDVVGGLCHLAHQVRGEEHGAALGREVPGESAHPEHALGVEPVDRLVEDEGRGVAEQGGRDAEALPHAEREPADALAGDGLEPGECR